MGRRPSYRLGPATTVGDTLGIAPAIHRYAEAFVRHDLAGCAATLAPSARYEIVGAHRTFRRGELPRLFEPLWRGFPDVAWRTVDLAPIGGGRVVWIWLLVGTHTGELYGHPPTGRRAVWPGAEILEAGPEGIDRVRAYLDFEELLDQLGIEPP